MHSQPVRVIDPAKTTELVIVGVGGTGGYVLQQVARLVFAMQEQGRPMPIITLIDGDHVEEKNLLRQYFLPQDVGKNKAVVLARRYAAAYGIEIDAWPYYVASDTELCNDNPRQSWEPNRAESEGALIRRGAVVVGCVDNGPTRRHLHEKLKHLSHVVYIDSGNGAARAPNEVDHLDRYELAKAAAEGWAGQVICGVRWGGIQKLPFPGEVLPDLLDGEDDPSLVVSCQDAAASNPQRLMTNLMAATCVMTYLHTLLADGTITNARTFFDARKGFTRSDPAINQLLEVHV